jgi:hypothetical protein
MPDTAAATSVAAMQQRCELEADVHDRMLPPRMSEAEARAAGTRAVQAAQAASRDCAARSWARAHAQVHEEGQLVDAGMLRCVGAIHIMPTSI